MKKVTIVRSKTSVGARKIARARFPAWTVISVLVTPPTLKEYRVTLKLKTKRRKK